MDPLRTSRPGGARRLRKAVVFCCAIVGSMYAPPACADEDVDFFENRIRPLLVQHCYECHSASSAEVQGGLRLDSRAAIRKGGESGPAVVPGKVSESLLLEAVRHESFEMPPDKKLPDAAITDLERWIEMGAPDPRDRPPTSSEAAELSWQTILAGRRNWWSLQPVQRPSLPDVDNAGWSKSPIDRFIARRLQQAELKPSEPAKPQTLIRRLSLVLLGLPPSPQQVSTFTREYAADPEAAYSRLVDELLDSPHFGERWARHWMDIVRFTETHGNEWNYEVHHAWRYRDYLIRGLNLDVPYDQLLREHIAGDLLPEPRWNDEAQFNESIIGTAFYRFGEVNHDDCIDLRQIGFDIADNQIDTLTKAFQATSVACARCHDHKLDAVSMKDYYALLGILRSSRLVSHTIDSPDVNQKPIRQLGELKAQIREELSATWLKQCEDIGTYLLAASAKREGSAGAAELAGDLDAERLTKWVAALDVEDPPVDHPLSPWLSLYGPSAASWQDVADRYRRLQLEHEKFNQDHFETFADFRAGGLADWEAGGQGLRSDPTSSGEYCIDVEGDSVVKSVLPAGCFTHTLSPKLNGTLRSPILTKGRKHLSFLVLGQHTSALRLVSNNCQLNYRNYRALTSDSLGWVTFTPPEDVESVRVYAELMTKFDNPKFPDQLGTLGGDSRNDRVPWAEAATDPRSYFGIAQAVLHDCAETPKPRLDHFSRLFDDVEAGGIGSLDDAAGAYAAVIHEAIDTWREARTTDADVKWIDWLLQNKLLDNSVSQTQRLADLVARYRSIERDELARPRIVPGVGDFDAGFEQQLLVRGDCRSTGAPVARRYLEVLAHANHPFDRSGSGRLALAHEMASPSNPLTARVMVNRVWHHLFGSGIVRSVDNFGHNGELPSHPELLDWLADRFIEDSWSIKRLIGQIVRSDTFRMSSRVDPSAREIDPDNRWLHHYPARRLDAEAIRDAILATSGRLDRTMWGPSIHPHRDQANSDRRLFPGPLDGAGRRSIYIKASLMEGAKFLGAFNFPGSKVTRGRRDVTNVPTQALALLNDPFVIQQSEFWADRMVNAQHDSIEDQIQAMFQQSLGRDPTLDEIEEFTGFIRELAKLHGLSDGGVQNETLVWKDVAHVILNLKEFIYIP